MSEFSNSQRRQVLRQARQVLFKLPRNEMFELAGQPTVYYELRDYRHHPQGKEEGIKTARADIGFMFKAFETGQVRLGGPHFWETRRACLQRSATGPHACAVASAQHASGCCSAHSEQCAVLVVHPWSTEAGFSLQHDASMPL